VAILLSRQNEQKLAILPLSNLSNDPEQQYFANELTEEFIDTISRLLRGHMGVIEQLASQCGRSVAMPPN